MKLISKTTAKNILAFLISLVLVLGVCYIFKDQLTDPKRWIRLPNIF